MFRYLSKPIERHRLFCNLKDALEVYNSSVTKYLIETKQRCHTIPASNLVSVEALGRKVTIHTLEGDYESIHPMKYWTEILTLNCFFPTHRSFIVNLLHISSFDHSMVYLCGGQYKAYLVRRKYTQFKQAYLLYLESTR